MRTKGQSSCVRARCDAKASAMLRECVNRPLESGDGIEPTRLYSHKRAVDYENDTQLRQLQTPVGQGGEGDMITKKNKKTPEREECGEGT